MAGNFPIRLVTYGYMGVGEKALGKRLQDARREAGLTQQELCQKAALSYSTLAKIERGAIRSPSVFTVAAIAAATGTTVEQLLDLPTVGSPALPAKKVSKTGIRFVYFDVGGVLVRSFHRAFTAVTQDTGAPIDAVEPLFWRHNDAVCRGEMSLAEFNAEFARELGVDTFDWADYYFKAVEAVPEAADLVRWASENYEVGLITNIMPGLLDGLMERGIVPKVPYKAILDSSKCGLIKPEPSIFEKAQSLAGVQPKEILYVDDNRANLSAGGQLGWRVQWFDDYHPEESIAKAREALVF